MNLTGLTTETSTFPGATANTEKSDLGKDDFMELLVAQMQNQDPMDPQSNDQFIAQLANFSSLEQMQNMNDNLLTMAVLQDNNALMSQLTTGSSLIGKDVSWVDPETGAAEHGTVNSLKVQGGLSYLDVGGKQVPLQIVDAIAPGDSSDETEA